MKQEESMNETLKRDFSVLTDENRKSVIDMTRFLVLTQKTIIPEMLNVKKESSVNEGKQGLA